MALTLSHCKSRHEMALCLLAVIGQEWHTRDVSLCCCSHSDSSPLPSLFLVQILQALYLVTSRSDACTEQEAWQIQSRIYLLKLIRLQWHYPAHSCKEEKKWTVKCETTEHGYVSMMHFLVQVEILHEKLAVCKEEPTSIKRGIRTGKHTDCALRISPWGQRA